MQEPYRTPPAIAQPCVGLMDRLGIGVPILSAPMAFAAGGALAAAVSRAGGLGLIGGGYGDADWLAAQFRAAGDAPVGVGFITWALHRAPGLLGEALAHRPRAVLLSFGDPQPFAAEIRAAGAALLCQCQTLDHVRAALDAGADAIIAQGSEAGGHGGSRGLFTLLPEVADLLRARGARVPLVAAGGIADGRGLAAALMLGASGVMLGTRLWAAEEALVHPRHHAAILATPGDGTIRTTVVDIARELPWPPGFTARVRYNRFVRAWHGREDALRADLAREGPAYRQAFAAGDPEATGVWFGEAAGMIQAIEPAGAIIARLLAEAQALLAARAG